MWVVFEHLDDDETAALAHALSKNARTLCGHDAFSSA